MPFFFFFARVAARNHARDSCALSAGSECIGGFPADVLEAGELRIACNVLTCSWSPLSCFTL